jgi:uncharacterized protein YbjT (DUF2867 family)
MHVVLGASGNTGHVVAQNLLSKGEKVRVVGRNADHLQFLAAKGGEPFVADFTDPQALTRAFQNAQSAYVLIPPNPKSNNVRAFQDLAMPSQKLCAVRESRMWFSSAASVPTKLPALGQWWGFTTLSKS